MVNKIFTVNFKNTYDIQYQNIMYLLYLICITFALALQSLITAQNVIQTNYQNTRGSIPVNYINETYISSSIQANRAKLFSDAFTKTVVASPQLLKVFDISAPSNEISIVVYQSGLSALLIGKIEHAELLAKVIADAVYLTVKFMTEDVYVYAIGSSVALHLISQNVLTPENSAPYGAGFANEILKHYPKNNTENRYLITRALSDGIVNFLASLVVYPVNGAPAFKIGAEKLFFASTVIAEPPFEVTVIAPPGTIPSVAEIYGVNSFTTTFLSIVDSSSTLRSILHVNEPVSVISKAWNDATFSFCASINYYASNTYAIGTAVAITYDHMIKSTYVKCISNGYALMLLGIGVLNADNASEEARKLANTMENLVNEANVINSNQIKETTIFRAFRYLLRSERNIVNKFATLVDRIEIEFYAVTDVVRPNLN